MAAEVLLLIEIEFEHGHLLLAEESPLATAQVFLGKSCKIHSVELAYPVTEGLEHTADDAVAARMDLDAHDAAVISVVGHLIGVCGTVLKVHALYEPVHILGLEVLVEGHLIYLLLLEGRMGQFLGELPVVGQQQHSGRGLVQTSYGENALGAHIPADELHHVLVGVGVAGGGHEVLGLVEQDVDLLLAAQTLSVEADVVLRGIDLHSHLGDNLSVDGHQTGGDILVGLAAGADAGVGDKLVETHHAVVLLHHCGCLGHTGLLHAGVLGAETVLEAAALLKLTVGTVSANERLTALSAESRLAAAESGLSSTESGLVTAVESRFVPAESGFVTAAEGRSVPTPESGLAGSVLTASTVSGPVAAEVLSVIVPAEIPAMLPGT